MIPFFFVGWMAALAGSLFPVMNMSAEFSDYLALFSQVVTVSYHFFFI